MSDKPETTQAPPANQQTPKASPKASPEGSPEGSIETSPEAIIEKSLESASSEKADGLSNTKQKAGQKTEQKQRLTVAEAVTVKLQAHKRSHFTGITYVATGEKLTWKLYFYLGKLTWAVAQTNQRRSWHRQLRAECPELLHSLHPNPEAGGSVENFPHQKIAYGKLIRQVQSKQLDRGPIAGAAENHLCEILFDILQEGTLRQQDGESHLSLIDKEKPFLGSHFLIVRSQIAWEKAQAGWKAWQEAELLNCSPNSKPVLSQTQQLKTDIPKDLYDCLTTPTKGDQCLRDLAVDHGYALLPFTKRIHPFIQQGMIGLVQIKDLKHAATAKQLPKIPTSKNPQLRQIIQPENTPSKAEKIGEQDVSQQVPLRLPQQVSLKLQGSKKNAKASAKKNSKPLVIYIEDSQMDSKIMGDILQKADCQYFNIQEPIHAIPLLIEKKPQLIFLDLVMPIANGYEICTQIRRISALKKVPIIIVTSNSGIIDRIRTKLKGANGFMSKPINPVKVLKILDRHIMPILGLKAS
ncbi:MAG: response regulator [Cyanobacteria bacterium J06649_5]